MNSWFWWIFWKRLFFVDFNIQSINLTFFLFQKNTRKFSNFLSKISKKEIIWMKNTLEYLGLVVHINFQKKKLKSFYSFLFIWNVTLSELYLGHRIISFYNLFAHFLQNFHVLCLLFKHFFCGIWMFSMHRFEVVLKCCYFLA